MQGFTQTYSQKVTAMAVLALFGVLIATSIVAPFLGADRGDARSVKARPKAGWFPAA
jgi:hypothetical protein